LRDEIRVQFPSSRFFIFDPTCNGTVMRPTPIKKYWVSREPNDLTFMEEIDFKELPEEEQSKWYKVWDSIVDIRVFLREQFKNVMEQNQFKVKAANAYVGCSMQLLQLRKVAMEYILDGKGEGSKTNEYIQ
jgi:hypothetical protein